jgi:hypothetical protein
MLRLTPSRRPDARQGHQLRHRVHAGPPHQAGLRPGRRGRGDPRHCPLTYASGTWEPVDWSRFDIVSVDAYRDARNARSFRADLRKRLTHGKPVVATEFGCCAYAGAADRGGLGWDIADYDEAGVATLRGEYERDESEQVRYLREVNQIFVEEVLDLAFWFTFAGYQYPVSSDPRRDADLASYGLVSLLREGPGRGYQGLGWRPRLAFETVAALRVR